MLAKKKSREKNRKSSEHFAPNLNKLLQSLTNLELIIKVAARQLGKLGSRRPQCSQN